VTRRRLITEDEAVQATAQHTKACSDCPWSRDSLNGWLGGNTAQEWISFAHGEVYIPCHVLEGAECAGAAIYRANVGKRTRIETMILQPDTKTVFSNPQEFLDHHGKD